MCRAETGVQRHQAVRANPIHPALHFIPVIVSFSLSMLSKISFGGLEGLTTVKIYITTPCGLAEESWRLIDLYI